jgi:hypothetical protein
VTTFEKEECTGVLVGVGGDERTWRLAVGVVVGQSKESEEAGFGAVLCFLVISTFFFYLFTDLLSRTNSKGHRNEQVKKEKRASALSVRLAVNRNRMRHSHSKRS